MAVNPTKIVKFIIGVLSLLITFLGSEDSSNSNE